MPTLQQKAVVKEAVLKNKLQRIFFISFALGSILISPQIALLMGLAFALVFGNPFLAQTKKFTPKLLAWCIVGLGAQMNLFNVMEVSARGFSYTLVGIALALAAGHILAKVLKTDKETALLVSVGTAICGGSAIVALASAIRAKDSSISISLATVFMLNAMALVLFPLIGHHLGLDQTQFGYWSALAIHDTSSVVGATLAYGPDANFIGTSVKLARALWIVPVTLILARVLKTEEKTAAKPPYFILGFLATAALVTFIPGLKEGGVLLSEAAKHGLSLALFLIGAGLSIDGLKTVGLRPLIFGVILWFLVASLSLLAIINGLIS